MKHVSVLACGLILGGCGGEAPAGQPVDPTAAACLALEDGSACRAAVDALQAEVDTINAAAHTRYADGEAVSAMGMEDAANPLNHARYTDMAALAAVAGVGYLTGESDPSCAGAPAAGITSTQISNWQTAHGWGDHGVAGYLTMESDPSVNAIGTATLACTVGQVAKYTGAFPNPWACGTDDTVTGTGAFSVNGPDAYYDAGNVGVGTTTPAAPLHVMGAAPFVHVETDTAGNNAGLRFYEAGVMKYFMYSDGANDRLRLGPLGSVGMTMDDTGSVGFGTAVPASPLHLESDDASYTELRMRNSTADSTWAYRVTAAGSGNAGNLEIRDLDSSIPRMVFEPDGDVGIGSFAPADRLHVNLTTAGSVGIRISNAQSYALRVGGASSSVGAGNLAIYDHTASRTRMVVTDTGDVGVGITNPTSKFMVFSSNTTASDNLLRATSPTGADFRVTMGGIVYMGGTALHSSDRSLKKSIATIENPLGVLRGLRGVSYNLRNREHDQRRHMGVVAQEVEAVLPDLVYESEGIKSVAYNELAGLFIEAIKQQAATIKAQDERLTDLEARLKALERRSP